MSAAAAGAVFDHHSFTARAIEDHLERFRREIFDGHVHPEAKGLCNGIKLRRGPTGWNAAVLPGGYRAVVEAEALVGDDEIGVDLH